MRLQKSELLRRLRQLAKGAADLRTSLALSSIQKGNEPMAIRGHCGGGSQD
jgi:hypothetical protein